MTAVISRRHFAAEIRPFRINVPVEQLEAMRKRIAATIWPEHETVSDESQGVQLATMQKLASYWATDYDWRKCEARLNALPNFITEIDGLDIHFIHARSKQANALPLIVTHGWPGSIIEQLGIIEPLMDTFHLVIPSMPGYGFSGKPTTAGWDPARIARAWVVLMQRLGYNRFLAQGGDWGGLIVQVMAQQAPPELLAIHTNFPATVPPDVAKSLAHGDPAPADLSADERRAYEKLAYASTHRGYAAEMGLRPQTLYALADSPVGLAAWMLDHDSTSYLQIAQGIVGTPVGGLTRDATLDNITLYWVTQTAVSSARLYWENKFPFFNAMDISVPTAVSVFPGERYQAPRSWAERAYRKLIYYNQLDVGGHFAAWEQPELLSSEIRAAFRSL
jgi:pimeloyl-ACP methyl ester carboxylesterase